MDNICTELSADLNVDKIHPSWQPFFNRALETVDSGYLENLRRSSHWLPGPDAIFNAFQIPLPQTKVILFGESPYPRLQSANGFAFWDAAVENIWSPTGLSKAVNRATSLRNFIKMLLIAEGMLSSDDTSQEAIASLNKSHCIQTGEALFKGMMKAGFCLLNASLVLSSKEKQKDARAWWPFVVSLLTQLSDNGYRLTLLLWGNIAKKINAVSELCHEKFIAEHPYNISFLHNETMLQFFEPFHLLRV